MLNQYTKILVSFIFTSSIFITALKIKLCKQKTQLQVEYMQLQWNLAKAALLLQYDLLNA